MCGCSTARELPVVEPVLNIFPFGSAPFARLVGELRRRII